MKNIFLMMIAAMMLLAVGACKKEGPAEKAGEKIDEAVDEIAH